jgi:hypothetical protein
MPETIADPPSLSFYPLFPGSGIQESQRLGPAPSAPHARDERGRFAKGSSGNPSGRPRGIRNPRRRVPDLVSQPLSPQALSNLLDRKPHLLRPLVLQLLPPPLAPIDPAERLGIDLASLHGVEDLQRLLPTVLAAIARGEITPSEGERLARRVRTRLRAIRRLARVRRIASVDGRG